jgi:hypothetical protein
MTSSFLVVSQHLIDNIPLCLHTRYSDAFREARENDRRGGPKSMFPLEDADPSEYICTIIIPYDECGRPLQGEAVGDKSKRLRVVRPSDSSGDGE